MHSFRSLTKKTDQFVAAVDTADYKPVAVVAVVVESKEVGCT